MIEPKLPEFKLLKTNPNNGKLLIPRKAKETIQVNPKFFDLRKTKLRGWILINHAYTNSRYAVEANFDIDKINGLINDCLKLAHYSKEYNVWLEEQSEEVIKQVMIDEGYVTKELIPHNVSNSMEGF